MPLKLKVFINFRFCNDNHFVLCILSDTKRNTSKQCATAYAQSCHNDQFLDDIGNSRPMCGVDVNDRSSIYSIGGRNTFELKITLSIE